MQLIYSAHHDVLLINLRFYRDQRYELTSNTKYTHIDTFFLHNGLETKYELTAVFFDANIKTGWLILS